MEYSKWHYHPPNKKSRIMSGLDIHKSKTKSNSLEVPENETFSGAFLLAEEKFQSQNDEWKTQKKRGRHTKLFKNKEDISTKPVVDDGRKNSRHNEVKEQGSHKPPSQECSDQGFNKHFPLHHGNGGYSRKQPLNCDKKRDFNEQDNVSNQGSNKRLNTSQSNSHNRQDKNHSSGFSFTRLQQISLKDSTDIIRILANSQNGLEELLSTNIKPDSMYLIVKILSKLTTSDWQENKEHVLMRAATPEFLKKTTEFVTFLVTDEQNYKRREEMEQFFDNLLTFFQSIMVLLPTVAAEHLKGPLRATKMAMENVTEYQNVTINLSLLDRMKQLISDFEERKKEKEERERILKEEKEAVYPKPLGNISDVPLYPRPEDLANCQGAIVPNKIKGPYNNVEHYLDVQFRLLREDFIAPVRQGINEFRIGHSNNKSQKRKKVNNIRLYQKVKFLKPKVILDKVGYDICIDPEKRLRVKWEYSKRFIYGSLLLFTTDNFHTFFLATVINRDLKTLEKNRTVSVVLCDTTELSQDILTKEFLMAESEVYFDPYYNVLKALQKFNSDTFPMKKYIVYVDNKTQRPAYTRNGSNVYTISAGVNGRKTIKLFEPQTWPTCDELEFDTAQLNAFQVALTTDLTIIQGPPGTGKTYLGLKIAAALLENSVVWNYDHKSPILVICYTNHALDQFLEGIVEKNLTNNLVRIGGRSKSELLEPFNLKERRRSVAYYSANYEQAALLRNLKKEMSDIFEKIKILQDNLDHLEKNDGLISLKSLQIVMNEHHSNFFRGNDDLIDWLLSGVRNKITCQKRLISTNDKRIEKKEGDNVFNEIEYDISDFENIARLKEVLFDNMELEVSDKLNNSNDNIRLFFSCTLDEIQKKVEEFDRLLDSLPSLEEKRESIQQKMKESKKAQNDLKMIHHYFEEKLNRTPIPSQDDTNKVYSFTDMNTLTCDQRWILYKSWIEFLKSGYWTMIGKLEERYRRGGRRYDEVRQFDDLRIVQQADVVGVTTTTAARLQAMLRELKPKIVIVEEAAEVLEAHIIASLSVYCQHLILIGDHKQLKPSPADYRLGKDYHLDVSLFERLINNGVNYHTLTTQHRMRPEISQLLVPNIYPLLNNHPTTLTRQQIRGMDTNIFFMTHNNYEEEVDDILSKKNLFEARMAMSLARHLLLQGYRPDEITVLATYSGQMYLMKDEQKRLEISPNLLVTVVDNFQGEESRIIILSLVRSNAENKIGFLKTENRVCVALSRARDGLFVFGNMDSLTGESVLWQKIKQSFLDQNAFGPALVLRCETHPKQLTRIVTPNDFNMVMEGGCSKPCGEKLPCGHLCKSLCHVSKDRHSRYRCSEPCNRFMCQDNHPCPSKCYQPCGQCKVSMKRTLACGHNIILPCCVEYRSLQCKEQVLLSFPECGHQVQVECYHQGHKQCPQPCPYRLECGHACTRTCHVLDDPDHLEYSCPKPCARQPLGCSTEGHKCPLACFEPCKPCKVNVVKKLPCDHSITTRCSNPVLDCKAMCSKIMSCGHRCSNECWEECGNCKVKVEKVVPLCGHKVKVRCCVVPEKKHCSGNCSVTLRCGHKCTMICSSPCSELYCEEPTPLPVALPCGHTGAVLPCNLINKVDIGSSSEKEQLVQYCSEPCLKMLDCGHRCSGTCGQCMQGRIHKVCDQDCGNTLICGHSCTVPCRKVCPPCDKRCQNRCIHNMCAKKCGEPCTPCNEPCLYSCVHSRCTKRCGELCNKEPCTEPCHLELPCKHLCVGFCGEPCPPCKQCCPELYEEFFFTGDETEEDAKWILLNDCKHVVESRCLEQWLGVDQEGSEIKLKTCPKCRPTERNRFIATTQRYMNLVKMTFKDIQTVKEKLFGEVKDIREKREKLLKDIRQIPSKDMDGFSNGQKGRDELKNLRVNLLKELNYIKNNRRNEISIHKAILLSFNAQVYQNIHKRVVDDWKKLTETCKEKAFKHINFLIQILNQRKSKISTEEMKSFNFELTRVNRILDILLIESCPNFIVLNSLDPVIKNKIVDLHTKLKQLVFTLTVFTEDVDNEVRLHLKEVSKLLNTVITDEERRQIHAAVAIYFHGGVQSTNRWYKCGGCGDVYCVENCGAVNQIAKCGRCKTTIGDHSRIADTAMLRALQR